MTPAEQERAAVATHWTKTGAPDLEAAIAEFKAALPDWWFSVCECQVSCDASCAPTSESPASGRIFYDSRFDEGFHADLPQPSTLAEALRDVMRQALAAMDAMDEVINTSDRIAKRMGGRFVPKTPSAGDKP